MKSKKNRIITSIIVMAMVLSFAAPTAVPTAAAAKKATRAQVITRLWKLAGSPTFTGDIGFSDVKAKDSYASAFRWAYRTGVLKKAKAIKPKTSATRQWIVTTFYSYSGKPDTSALSAGFKDESKIAKKSKATVIPAMRWAYANDLMKGICKKNLSPKSGVTAKQLKTIAKNYKEKAAKEPIAVSVLDTECAPSGLTLAEDGSLVVTDTWNKKIWRVIAGKAKLVAGADSVIGMDDAPVGGYNDGDADKALFKECFAVVPFIGGWAVSDTNNGAIRIIKNGQVTYLTKSIETPTGLTTDPEGNLYVADRDKGEIRVVNVTDEKVKITTLISDLNEPMGIVYHNGSIYVAESGANRIVSVSIADKKLTVVAGSGEEDMTDGAAASATFASPVALAITSSGVIYVADYANGAIRMIKSETVSTLISDVDSEIIAGPMGLAVCGKRLYYADNFLKKVYSIAI